MSDESKMEKDESILLRDESSPASDERITINVSGRRFETLASTLRRLPHSLLGDEQRRAAFADGHGELFFDRSSSSFEGVLHAYQSGGDVQRPSGVPVHVFLDDVRFYGLGAAAEQLARRREGLDAPPPPPPPPAAAGCRGRLAAWLERPAADVASALVTAVAVLAFIVETWPRGWDEFGDSVALIAAQYVEVVCVALLFVETVTRFAMCPCKVRFFLDPMNVVDLLATVPFFVFAVLETLSTSLRSVFWIGAVARLARILRILRFVRNTSAGVTLKHTAAAAAPLIGVCFILWLVAVLVFACLFYWSERWVEDWVTMPIALWWAIVTMTTVGYGDVYPKTTAGRVFASMCAYFGYAMAALPIAILVSKFARFNEASSLAKKRRF